MTDCPNAEMRDRLPDLLHDRLDVRMRAAVLAHVDDCADCRAELALLEGVRGMMDARTPRVDINYVVNALPKQYAKVRRVARDGAPRQRTWADWRIAAAVTVLAVGGGSVAIMNHGQTRSAVVATTDSSQPRTRATATVAAIDSSVPSTTGTSSSSTTPRVQQTVASADDGSVTSGLATGDLNEQQLRALLEEIDQLQAVPVTEPEPVTIRVNSGASSSPEGA
jgi:hypothetical protein